MLSHLPAQSPRDALSLAGHSVWLALTLFALTLPACAFEGRIRAVTMRGDETNTLFYTVGSDQLRIEVTSSDWPNPIDIVERQSGALTLVYPHNRSFVRLKPATENASGAMPGAPGMPMPPIPAGIGPTNLPGAPAMPPMLAMPPGIGPQPGGTPTGAGGMPATPPMPTMPPGFGPQPGGTPASVAVMPNIPAPLGARPPMPMRPMMMKKLELKDTGGTTNILGFVCRQYQLKQRGETMDFWATDQLLPFQPYVRNQPHRFGPRMIEEQWPKLVSDQKLFPLLVSLHYDKGAERYRFEVTSVKEEKVTDPDGKLFQPPKGYHEIQPLPF